jgi:hypothetical protein
VKTRLRSIIERALTYGLIALAVGALVYFLSAVNTKQKQEIIDKTVELAEMKQKLEKAQSGFAAEKIKVEDITKDLRTKQQKVREQFDNVLESASNYTRFIEQIQRKAKALNIHIQDSQYQPPAPAGGVGSTYLEFKFDLRVRGSYNKIKQFLWELENSLGRLVKIAQIEIIPPLSDDSGNMSLKLTLVTFFKS